MRIPVCAVAALAAFLLFGGAGEVRAATPPVIDEVYSVAPSRDPAGPTVPTIVTVIGKGLTKLKTFTLLDSFGQPTGAPVGVLVRSKKLLVFRMPLGLAEGRYIIEAAYGDAVGEKVQISAVLTDITTPGLVNDPTNPVDWSRLKGVPSAFADGDEAWTESGGDVYRESGRVGVGTTSPDAALHVTGIDGVVFEGTLDQGTLPALATGPRMVWYAGKAAFRAGYAVGSEWDDGNVGPWSAALGTGTIASGTGSFAAGTGTTASGSNGFAMGNLSSASAISATALGSGAVASGNFATALGLGTTASGIASLAAGELCTASTSNAVALGYATTASGFRSTALCSNTTASGFAATAIGFNTTAQAYGSVALGRYNVVEGSTLSWEATDPVLVVGNGDSMTASNAFTLLKNGNLTIAGTLTENSDGRLKEDVAPLSGVLGRIAGIRAVTYRVKDAHRGPAGPQIGLLAQEVREAFPELVHEDAQGTLSVAYGKLSAVLLEAVKEQQAALEARDRRIEGLEERLARLEARAAVPEEPPGATGAR